MEKYIYCRKLTKEELIKSGIMYITKDGMVFNKDGNERNTFISGNYKRIQIYDFDKNGNKIKVHENERYKGHYYYKMRTVSVQRAMGAGWYNEVPEGFVVDHINNKHLDNRLENLQLLTPEDNTNKEKPNNNKRLVKCKLNLPREWYVEKLKYYLEQNRLAKLNKQAALAHKGRTYVSNYKARLRYYDSIINSSNNSK